MSLLSLCACVWIQHDPVEDFESVISKIMKTFKYVIAQCSSSDYKHKENMFVEIYQLTSTAKILSVSISFAFEEE